MSVLNPVRVDQILPLYKTQLDTTAMQTLLGGTGRVLVAQGNVIEDAFPDVDSNGFAARIILMLRNDSPYEFMDMTVPLYWNLKVEMIRGRDDANIFLNKVQTVAYSILQNTTISPADSTQLYKTWRKRLSSHVRYEDAVGWYYLTGIYQTILTPN